MSPYQKMADSGMGFAHGLRSGRFSLRLFFAYVFDWVSLIAVAGIAAVLGRIEPNKRPFSLVDPDISFPFTEHETVPPWLLLVLNAAVPIVIITVVSLIFVPGPTVPKDTPKTLIWKRKLWELHVGLLGLALALVSAWFFTESMKNMFGKPRPDLLSRCEPDFKNAADYRIGGYVGENMNGQLYSADICQQKDSAKLNDGFRSYPSGHSSSAAAGLIYTSLFLASKFAVTIPFVLPVAAPSGAATHAAFPSRMRSEVDPYEPTRTREALDSRSINSSPYNSKAAARQNVQNMALRRQAAAPPIYLLVIVLMPFCLAVFIASSRWFDFRHHGFDILFGFLMGVLTSIYSFRYYHLPIQEGAGWAWGPRSEDRAFWAGVGVLGYAGDKAHLQRSPTHDLGESGDTAYHPPVTSGALSQRPIAHLDEQSREPRQFQSVELTRMDSRDRVEERGI